MKFFILLTILFHTITPELHAYTVYGKDNRIEVYEASDANQLLAKSTAAMIARGDLRSDLNHPELIQLKQITMQEEINKAFHEVSKEISLCKEVRFLNQLSLGVCSGFLIAPDLIMTAGHCLKNPCEQFDWVFDYKVNKDGEINIQEENIYRCKKYVSKGTNFLDYGLIQLDRAVKNRTPLEIRSQGKALRNQPVLSIGNPLGLPTKVADEAYMEDLEDGYYAGNTDSFQGSSGSAVLNANSGTVEGMVSSGAIDWVADKKNKCIAENIRSQNTTMGSFERILRTSAIPEVMMQNQLNQVSTTGDIKTLKKILENPLWVDFHTHDGQTALMKASKTAQKNVMNILIERGADVNYQDTDGNTPLHHLAVILNNKNSRALKVLIKSKANLNIKNNNGETPLMLAGRLLNHEGVKLLLDVASNHIEN